MNPLRSILANMEKKRAGDYCFEAGCVEPGVDNVNTIIRKVLEKIET